MKKSILYLATVFTFLFSCSDDDSSDTQENNNPETPEAEIPDTPKAINLKLVNNSTFGNIITDGEGKSLYFFSKDTKATSECNGDCEAIWPIFYTKELNLGEGLNSENFGVITRKDGKKQNTFKALCF